MNLFLLLSLATWRFSSLLADEDGPFEIFEKIRTFLGVRTDPKTGKQFFMNSIAKGVVCVWCNSIWFGGLLALLLDNTSVIMYLLHVLALSAIAVIIDTALLRKLEVSQ